MFVSEPIFCSRFIGRDAELALLLERYRDAAAGRGSIVLVSGDAGIGKSRLLEVMRSHVEDQGGAFAVGQCLEHSSSPLAPLAEGLAMFDAARPAILQSDPPLRRILGCLLPALAGDELPSIDRSGLHNAVVGALSAFARDRPTVLAFEDAHWADLATLELLAYLAARIASSKLVLVANYRTDEVERRPALAATIAKIGGARRTWQLRLPPLEPQHVRALVTDALAGRGWVPRDRLRDVVELAEGNPLMAEELLRSALESGSAQIGAGAPLSVRAVVQARTEALDRSDRMTLACAATIGRRFDAALLGRISRCPPERIAELLRFARDRQLLAPDPVAHGVYVFKHALVQEALRSELLPEEAEVLHDMIARELEQLPESEERSAALAHHWWYARNSERARLATETAGDRAARRFAHHDAARMYERALTLAPPESRERALLDQKLGRALGAAAPGQRSAEAFTRCYAYFERHGDRMKCAELALDLAQQAWILSRSDESLAWRLRALEVTADVPDHPLRFAALASMVFHCALVGDPSAAQRYVDEAQSFRGTAAVEHLAQFRTFRAMTLQLRGDIPAMLADLDGSIEVAARPSPDVHALVVSYCSAGYRAMAAGECDIAARMFESAIGTARDRFVQDFEAYDVAGLAQLMFVRGDWARARELLMESAELSSDSEIPWIKMQQTSVAIPLALRTADDALLERFAREELIEPSFLTNEPRCYAAIAAAFAELFAARGENERAAAILHRALEAIPSIGGAPTLGISVASHGDARDFARARQLQEQWAAPGNRAGAALLGLFEAIVAAREGREDAVRLACAAAAGAAALGFPYAEAGALELAGRSEEALARYRALGSRRDVERLERRRLNRRGRAPNELTERETEIAALVGAGESNRAIADALSLSERTVEHHVASILAKLDAGSRAQIAAAAARAGARPPER